MKTKEPWMRPGDEGFLDPPGGDQLITTDWKHLFFDLARHDVENGHDPTRTFRAYAEFEKMLKHSRRGGRPEKPLTANAAAYYLSRRDAGDSGTMKAILAAGGFKVSAGAVSAWLRRKKTT